jgi:hypothetical protein
MALVEKIDSNSTGLRFCEEASMGVLPATAAQVWYPLEPNSYSDFGGEVTTLARRPINASRQNQKGVVVDLDASGGLNQDMTQNNTTRLERGFFFADIREMYDSQSAMLTRRSLPTIPSTCSTATISPLRKFLHNLSSCRRRSRTRPTTA